MEYGYPLCCICVLLLFDVHVRAYHQCALIHYTMYQAQDDLLHVVNYELTISDAFTWHLEKKKGQKQVSHAEVGELYNVILSINNH